MLSILLIYASIDNQKPTTWNFLVIHYKEASILQPLCFVWYSAFFFK